MKVIQATRMVVPGTCLVSTTGTTQAHFFGSMATLVVVQLVPIIFLVIVRSMTMPTLVIALLHIVQDRLRPFVQLFGVPLLVTLDLDQYVVGHQDDGKEAEQEYDLARCGRFAPLLGTPVLVVLGAGFVRGQGLFGVVDGSATGDRSALTAGRHGED